MPIVSDSELNRVWMSDITYLRTGEGWLYLNAIHCPAQHPAGMTIADRAQVQPALTGAKVGPIRHPHSGELTSV